MVWRLGARRGGWLSRSWEFMRLRYKVFGVRLVEQEWLVCCAWRHGVRVVDCNAALGSE